MIGSILVANRGEIARRVVRTCRDLGIATVAVHSDADAGAAHVREAGTAVRLPGSAPAETYLRGDLLVKAALAAGAEAVHPGYGFLSENAAFAREVRDAGLTWIGPPPEAIEAMGSKTRAKRIMAGAGVPLLAGVDPASVTGAQLPLLVKAAAGGGGRGMRIVRELGALEAELAAARQEAASAFGDGEVFLEPYLEGGRHIEVQILADTHGTVWALGERDCSVQRRHQKVVEETPAPGLPDRVRRTLHESAVAAARAIGYTGAGTVEFLVAADGRAYFLEMNTRLQVEHPVTECVTGLDLVAEQIRVAEGARLSGAPPRPRGHAIEARLYAEDPADDWRPRTGTVHRLELPGPVSEFGCPPGAAAGLRLDCGVGPGETVGTRYDPMLAKVIAWAPTRPEAVRRLAHALERARLHGPGTNRELLVAVVRHPEFAAGRPTTGFLTDHWAALTAPDPRRAEYAGLSALAAALADAARARRGTGVTARAGGWRNVPSQPRTRCYRADPDGTEHRVRYRYTRHGTAAEDHPGVTVVAAGPDRVVLDASGVRREFAVAAYGERVYVDSPLGAFAFTALPRFPEPVAETAPGSLLAPMPGTVVRVAEVAVGEPVAAGTPLVWLEAMKMEHLVSAPTTGVLRALHAEPGRQVDVGTVLAVVTEEEHTP
ncbi:MULTISPECIES: ATP-binding protein [Streptomycetaceae]|uniref:Acetyl/propionyl CoA carboxylase, alpha subunit n=1 Tax=Streptantibioticus cattleyicolor (strain ATCC 35852 / DSM 46488 / JCM 4925 / NBRC 14057 / NRRL 8057) TaxID=1003195 RepID=G8X0P8_STREN|nr:biotin carboxylase N-terminal domain-containing protein [Streptantibioticus cattleyicolor]AEW97287.1 acetyl/propionyl CoA carboxylase, alpha subunit [Streptantibioticus cattleyicolor NRRL 8057 = DSM 46488]MYS61740.1 acety-l/propionyl-CoA carboxylase subunit alpha [Streptomyces sp. SID5468]